MHNNNGKNEYKKKAVSRLILKKCLHISIVSNAFYLQVNHQRAIASRRIALKR